MRISDWSSDVCSSDLFLGAPERDGLDRLSGLTDGPVIFAGNHHSHLDTPVVLTSIPEPWRHRVFVGAAADYFFRTRLTSVASEIGRASCRERVCPYV